MMHKRWLNESHSDSIRTKIRWIELTERGMCSSASHASRLVLSETLFGIGKPVVPYEYMFYVFIRLLFMLLLVGKIFSPFSCISNMHAWAIYRSQTDTGPHSRSSCESRRTASAADWIKIMFTCFGSADKTARKMFDSKATWNRLTLTGSQDENPFWLPFSGLVYRFGSTTISLRRHTFISHWLNSLNFFFLTHSFLRLRSLLSELGKEELEELEREAKVKENNVGINAQLIFHLPFLRWVKTEDSSTSFEAENANSCRTTRRRTKLTFLSSQQNRVSDLWFRTCASYDVTFVGCRPE